tara:strand:- start:327 stop:500 length:174 start_codon:yes stop_codon:yes gene_type:complete
MNEYELKRIDRITGDFSELCSNCLSASTEALREDSPIHTILEGLDSPLELLADLEIN